MLDTVIFRSNGQKWRILSTDTEDDNVMNVKAGVNILKHTPAMTVVPASSSTPFHAKPAPAAASKPACTTGEAAVTNNDGITGGENF